ncbi:MAG: type II secretory pathway component PulC [Chlamydiales bacterium]|jgi:type II secretory pathway component PulC
MNVTTIKAVCWSTSVAATLYLSYHVWDFYEHLDQSTATVDPVAVKTLLDENLDLTIQVAERTDYGDIKRTYVDMNWTGQKAVVPTRVVEKGPVEPAGPVYVPVASLLSILMIQVDLGDSADSCILVRYLGNGITAEQGTLSEGETLPAPHDGITLKKIDVDGVVFSFANEARGDETLSPAAGGGDEALIVRVGPGGERHPVTGGFSIPVAKNQVAFRPEETTLVGTNKYRIGTKDAEYLGQNFAQVLTHEVGTRVHYDERTGKRNGVEVTRVQPGSVAERHGAQAGDIIKSINGHPVTSKQEAVKFVKNNQDRYSVWEVVVENLGRERTVVYESPSD